MILIDEPGYYPAVTAHDLWQLSDVGVIVVLEIRLGFEHIQVRGKLVANKGSISSSISSRSYEDRFNSALVPFYSSGRNVPDLFRSMADKSPLVL